MKLLDLAASLALYGQWTSADDGRELSYDAGGADPSHGFALLGQNVEDGVLECTITLAQPTREAGAFLVFRAKGQEQYYAAGLGGWEHAYSLAEGSHLRLNRLTGAGHSANLNAGRAYHVRVALEGQRVQVTVDNVKVIDYDRLQLTGGASIGFYCFRGTKAAAFRDLAFDSRRPNAFVAMQFTSPYNEVYQDAIHPLVAEIGFDPVRVDEIAAPGVILSDIWNHIFEASVVIAEVSEPNPNVYYEVGAAHALNKPTILLAQRGTKLPFDLGPHRCIFYDNTIPGRAKLQGAIRNSLTSLLGLSRVGAA